MTAWIQLLPDCAARESLSRPELGQEPPGCLDLEADRPRLKLQQYSAVASACESSITRDEVLNPWLKSEANMPRLGELATPEAGTGGWCKPKAGTPT